jgi:CDP-diacylglycerol--serine O-phosphatidyltransferase
MRRVPAWRFAIPASVTLLNMACATASMVCSFAGSYRHASMLLFLAAVLDKLDGTVARRLNATSRWGGAMDSLADAYAYAGAAPILIFWFLVTAGLPALGLAGLAVSTLLVSSRLVIFEYLARHPEKTPPRDLLGQAVPSPGRGFLGMPSTMMGLFIPDLWLVFQETPWAFFFGSLAVSVAMVTPLAYGKLSDDHMAWVTTRVRMGAARMGLVWGALLGTLLVGLAATLFAVVVLGWDPGIGAEAIHRGEQAAGVVALVCLVAYMLSPLGRRFVSPGP